jgi:hypothetical protein
MLDAIVEPGRSVAVSALTHAPAEELANHRAELQTAALRASLGTREIQAVLNSRPDLPRPLLAAEYGAMEALLDHAGFVGRDELRISLSARPSSDTAAAAAQASSYPRVPRHRGQPSRRARSPIMHWSSMNTDGRRVDWSCSSAIQVPCGYLRLTPGQIP